MAPLADLQAIDSRLRELRQIIADIPLRRAREEDRIKDDRDSLAGAREALKNAQANVAQSELEANACREKIIKLKQQQMTLKTNKEFKAMEKEIRGFETELDQCENRQIEAMEEVEPARRRLEECEERLNEEQATVEAYIRQIEERLKESQSALDACALEREAHVKKVPEDMLRSYERLLQNKWPPVVKLEGNVCGGCHMTQPPSAMHNLRRGNAIVGCQFCGRMLQL